MALDRSGGRYTTDDVLDAIKGGKQQLWLIKDNDLVRAALTTEVRMYPTGKKVCCVRMCAGEDHREWVPLIEQLSLWAKEQCCEIMEVMGRDGWTPALKAMGYHRTQAVFELEI